MRLAPVVLFAFLLHAEEWRDPSPHQTKLITVDDGVQLEVLDWGGSGHAVVLLAGLGDTAHVYDDFAPRLAKAHHVYGITRRGHGRSSTPISGYEPDRLAEDVIRIIKALRIKSPVIVGHSFAGEEMHVLGSRYAAEIAGLVYIDAAFNRSHRSDDYNAVAAKLPREPAPETKDMKSVAAFRAFRATNDGATLPEAHLRARYVINPDESVQGPWLPVASVRQAFAAVMRRFSEAYNPDPIVVPALAIFAVPKSPDDLMRPWYKGDDAATRENVDKLFKLDRDRYRRHIEWFETFARRNRVIAIPGAHHLFITHPDAVLAEITNFASALP